ncbi:NAD(P)-binding protein [Marasmius fiardii PR-910]|nr:NAD(P)-binding protein [Marasmius fiardii PR-910]
MSDVSVIPQATKAVVVRKGTKSSSNLVHDAVLESRPLRQLEDGEVLVKIGAVAFNHRDVCHRQVWIRKGLYPAIGFGNVFGADGAGTVIAAHNPKDPLLNQRVFLSPQHGWCSDPEAPESPKFAVIGGTVWPDVGTFAEYVVVSREYVLPSPSHLDDAHVAAWPLAGVTAWRATMINGLVSADQNVLITGIGGGVALTALQLCIAKGANVFVTSGSPEKIQKAEKLGAKGGVSYKDSNWGKNLQALLKKTTESGQLDVVIDAGGGDVMGIVGNALKQGGRVVCYGMHANPEIKFTMRQVMRNQKLLGSTMGSVADLKSATEFVAQHRIVPVISTVLDGLDKAEDGFKMLNEGDQFGKVVIKVDTFSDRARL